jgi:hypothetical protein
MEFWAQKGDRNLIGVELDKRTESEPPTPGAINCCTWPKEDWRVLGGPPGIAAMTERVAGQPPTLVN